METYVINPRNKNNPYKEADTIEYKKITNAIFVKEFITFFEKEFQNSNGEVGDLLFEVLIHLFLLLNHYRKLWLVDEFGMNFRFINRMTNFIDYLNANYSKKIEEFVFKNVFVYFIYPISSEINNSKLRNLPVTMAGYLNEVLYIADGTNFTLGDFSTLVNLNPTKIGQLHGYVYSKDFDYSIHKKTARVSIDCTIQVGNYEWKKQIYGYATDVTNEKLHEEQYNHLQNLINELNTYLPNHIHITTKFDFSLR